MCNQQWYDKCTGTPKTAAANVYVPVSLSGFGIGITALKESIGLRKKTSFGASLSHNVRISSSNFLALGYGLGVQNVSYDLDLLRTYSDFSVGGIDLNSSDLSVTLGMFYYTPRYFLGLSSNMLITDMDLYKGWQLPGLDFTSGLMFRVNSFLLFRPDMVLKYYPVKQYSFIDGKENQSIVDPIIDVAANFLLFEKLWLGTSHRFAQAQTFSADVIVKEKFRIGYTFELGIGKTINQFNSHGIRLVWNFIPEKALQSFDRSGRHDVKGMMNTYLYR